MEGINTIWRRDELGPCPVAKREEVPTSVLTVW
jgi:hypothetical protein